MTCSLCRWLDRHIALFIVNLRGNTGFEPASSTPKDRLHSDDIPDRETSHAKVQGIDLHTTVTPHFRQSYNPILVFALSVTRPVCDEPSERMPAW